MSVRDLRQNNAELYSPVVQIDRDTMKIPQYLFRGDSDPQRKRQLRSAWPGSSAYGIFSNLSNSGVGHDIFNSPLKALVNRHVAIGWEKSHFLSFSESRERALDFAAGPTKVELKSIESDPWDTCLMTLCTDCFIAEPEQLEIGAYKCIYRGLAPRRIDALPLAEYIAATVAVLSQTRPNIEILLVNVERFLTEKAQAVFQEALNNAQRDREWLVLPLDRFDPGSPELTSKLDDACITTFERFRIG